MIVDDTRDEMTDYDANGPERREGGTTNEFTTIEQLTPEQRSAMEQLLKRYGDVFRDSLGTTHLMEHVIRVTDETA